MQELHITKYQCSVSTTKKNILQDLDENVEGL
jgi:hypothetical protein